MMGWMRRHGQLELILVLADGSTSLIPAAWTDLQAPAVEEPARVGTLGALEDLLAARRVLDGVLRDAVLAGEHDLEQPSSEEISDDSATTPRSRREPSARGGAVGAAGRGASPQRDGAAEHDDRAERGGRAGGDRR